VFFKNIQRPVSLLDETCSILELKLELKRKIAFSIGDTAGIGVEVLLKTLLSDRLMDCCTPVIYASSEFISETAASLGLDQCSIFKVDSVEAAMPSRLNILNVWNTSAPVIPGSPSSITGKMAFQSLEKAFHDVRSGKLDALITAPIDKKNIQQEGFSFPGHTEYLASGTDTADYLMLLVSGGLRVGVVTGHIPLRSVADALNTSDILKKVLVLDKSLKMDFGISHPKLALLALNPHAGDGGLLGDEEIKIIKPAIEQARNLGVEAFGPFPADGFFGSDTFKDYDGILGMYHDQGLIPFKAASFGSGVNFTAGLPIIRCSPDHGTAYNIAGQGKADPSSMKEAIQLALDIIGKRRPQR